MDERQSTGDGLKNVGDVCGLVSITACLGDAGEGTIAATAHSPASFSSRRVGPNLRATAHAFSAPTLCLLRCAEARTGAALGARCSARVTPVCVWAAVHARCVEAARELLKRCTQRTRAAPISAVRGLASRGGVRARVKLQQINLRCCAHTGARGGEAAAARGVSLRAARERRLEQIVQHFGNDLWIRACERLKALQTSKQTPVGVYTQPQKWSHVTCNRCCSAADDASAAVVLLLPFK